MIIEEADNKRRGAQHGVAIRMLHALRTTPTACRCGARATGLRGGPDGGLTAACDECRTSVRSGGDPARSIALLRRKLRLAMIR